MKFVLFTNFVAVSTCSLDFFEALLQLVALPAPLSGLFFIPVPFEPAALLAAVTPPNHIVTYAHGASITCRLAAVPTS